MQLFELSSDALDRCGEPDDCFAGFTGAASEARYGHPGNTDGGGTSAEATGSQYSAVAGTASSALPGQLGTEKGCVDASLVDGMT